MVRWHYKGFSSTGLARHLLHVHAVRQLRWRRPVASCTSHSTKEIKPGLMTGLLEPEVSQKQRHGMPCVGSLKRCTLARG